MDAWINKPNYRTYISSKINKDEPFAFFDLDETLITSYKSKNPAIFNKDPEDWIYLGDIIGKLEQLVEDRFNIVIVTNQTYLARKDGEILMVKFNNIIEDLKVWGINVSFLISFLTGAILFINIVNRLFKIFPLATPIDLR